MKKLIFFLILIPQLVFGQTTLNWLEPMSFQAPVPLSGITTCIGMGDSFTVGLNATGNNGYYQKFCTDNALAQNNQGASGKGAWQAQKSYGVLAFDRKSTLATVMIGFNDLRLGGSANLTLKKLEACYTAIVLKSIGLGQTPAGSAAVTRTGSPTGYAASTYGGIYGTGTAPGQFAMVSTLPLDSWSWTFTGTAFGLQFIGSDGVTEIMGTARIYIDGVLKDTKYLNNWYDGLSDGTYDNKRGPVVFTYHGLSNASHTIKVEAAGDGKVALDFFSTISSPANSAKTIFCEIPYMDATGYATVPANGSNAVFDAGSNVAKGVVKKYLTLGFPITFAYVNSTNGGDYIATTSSGLSSSDHVHPNDTGHGQLETSLNRQIIISYPTIFQATTSAQGDHVYLIYNNTLANVIPATTDFTLSSNSATAVSRTGLNNNIIDLTLNSSYASGATPTVSYTPGTNKIQDAAGKLAVALTNQNIENFVFTNTKSATFPAANTVAKTAANPANLSTSSGTQDATAGYTILMNLKFVGNGTYQRFVELGKSTGGNPNIVEFRVDITTNKLYNIQYSSATDSKGQAMNSAITASTWMKIIATSSPANGMAIYRDNSGALASVPIISASYTAMPAVDATMVLAVGGRADGGLPVTTSLIDEVIWVNKELNALERDEYWAGTVKPGNMLNASFSGNIQAYYHLDSNLNDASANGYNMTSTATPTYNVDIP